MIYISVTRYTFSLRGICKQVADGTRTGLFLRVRTTVASYANDLRLRRLNFSAGCLTIDDITVVRK